MILILNEISKIPKKDKNFVLILFNSKSKYIKRVSASLSRGLEAGGINVDYFNIHRFKIDKIKKYDIIGIGITTHYKGMLKSIKLLLSKLNRFDLEGKKLFIFEIQAIFSLGGSSGRKILKIMRQRNMRLLYPIISIKKFSNNSPLRKNSLHKMEKIGLEIAELVYKKLKIKSDEL